MAALDSQVGGLHGDVARRLVKKLLVALLGGLEPFLQPPDLADVRPDLHDQFHIALAVADGGGVDHHRAPGAIGIYHRDPAAHARAGSKSLFDWRQFRIILGIGRTRRSAHMVPQPLPVQWIDGDDLPAAVVDGDEAGQFVETVDARIQIAGNAAERRRETLNGLAHGRQPFSFHQPGGLFAYQVFQILGVSPQLRTHADTIVGPLEGNLQDIVVDGLGDEIGGLQLQALDSQIHVSVAGEHDHFRVRAFGLDLLEQVDAVHDGHLDVGENDGRAVLPENRQRLLAVLRGEHLVADVHEGDTQNFPDAFLIIDQQDFLFHFYSFRKAMSPTAVSSRSCASGGFSR